jgi:dGTPase
MGGQRPTKKQHKPELNWDKLLCAERFRPSSTRSDSNDYRTPFESDFDRVVFSSSFRRLQDKTQVWPLEAHDFVRTRLTHSCEAAVIGRSLVLGVFGAMRNRLSIDPHRPAAAVATACLLHDIGNPPFGHTGEDHIASWFKAKIEDL